MVRLPEGFTLHHHERVVSTNDLAHRLAEAGAPEGQVVWADEQTGGRGRHGRAWTSPPGNLYASVLLRPSCAMADATQLSLVAALALAEALESLGPAGVGPRLKWPNDVLIDGAKVAGLLLEGAPDRDGRCAFVIIGSGVNLTSCPDGTPYPAGHLRRAGFVPDLGPGIVLEAYLAALATWLRAWLAGGFTVVREAWLARAFGIGGEVRLRLDREELAGRFLDLTENGALLLEQAGGQRRRIVAGDVFALGG
jgi:BirA family biotin operon repressor/biotin-[acetyl-CoA-carboxylase] ligase